MERIAAPGQVRPAAEEEVRRIEPRLKDVLSAYEADLLHRAEAGELVCACGQPLVGAKLIFEGYEDIVLYCSEVGGAGSSNTSLTFSGMMRVVRFASEKKKSMNASEAKRTPLSDILAHIGYDPHHQARGEFWYFSPFREETIPSFKINLERNIWYDFGAGEGGNILDFILKYYDLATISEALGQLEALTRGSGIEPIAASVSRAVPETVSHYPTGAKIEIVTTKPLTHRALISYLNERGIAAATAHPFVKEGYYTVNGSYNRRGRPFFALAFANNAGGYELRNKFFKGASSKDISLVQASGPGNDMAVFEGFMDFLSAVTWYGPEQFSRPSLVLNAVAMRERAIAAIRQRQPGQVSLYLDRDPVGRELTTFFGEQLADIPLVDASDLYAGFKDFNAFLVAHKGLKQS